MGGEFLKSTFEAGSEIGHMRSELLKQGFSQQQVEAAYKAATETQQKVLPSTVVGNMEVISSLMAVLQDPDAAIKLMPDYSKAATVLSRSGKAGDLFGLMSSVRAGEFRGVLSRYDEQTKQEVIDPSGLNKMLQEIQAANVITHGQIGPSEFYSFMRSGGAAAAMLKDETMFFQMLPLIQSMGASTAGTSLKSYSQQFSSGRMSQATAALLSQVGLIHGGEDIKHNKLIKLNPVGNVILLPGAMDPGAQQQAREHPMDFIYSQLVPREQTWLAKNYGKTYTGASREVQDEMLLASLQQISSRIPGGTFMMEAVRNRLLTERDVTAGRAAMQRDPYATQVANDPKVQSAALISSWRAFEGALGDAAMKPAIELLNALTKDLNALADWARKNPDGAEKAMKGLAAGVATLGGGAALASAIKLATGPASLFVLAAGVEALGHGLTSWPSWLINMAAGAVAGAKFGTPGVIAGGLGGALWNSGPSALNNTGWSPLHPFSLSHTGPDGQLHYSWENQQSAAPPVTMQNQGARTTPVPVHITNPGDLTNGVGQGLSHSMNKPQQGISGFDTSTSDLNGIYYGLGGFP